MNTIKFIDNREEADEPREGSIFRVKDSAVFYILVSHTEEVSHKEEWCAKSLVGDVNWNGWRSSIDLATSQLEFLGNNVEITLTVK